MQKDSQIAPRSLRAHHMDYTRSVIMQALAEVIAERGAQSFTVQNVADRAGVSHRTVYRHFSSRDALVDGLADWLDEQLHRHGAIGVPETIDDLVEGTPFIYQLFDNYEVLVRALAIVYSASHIRLRAREERNEAFERVLRESVPDASSEEQRWLFAVSRILLSNHAWFFFHDHLGMDGAESGRAVQWALQTLIESLHGQKAASDTPSTDEA